jgi:hypothetical protein
MLGAAWAAIMGPPEAAAPRRGCLGDVAAAITQANAATDFLKREVALAVLAEARHDAIHGREAVCHAAVALARSQLRD